MQRRPESDLVTCYQVSCDRCKLIVEGEQVVRTLSGTWVESRQDSLETRRDILQQIAQQLHLERPLPPASIEVKSVVPAEFAPETKIKLESPLPAARAKMVITRTYASSAELDECFAFEQSLDEVFTDSEDGFVDGNELGGGRYAIFLYGPRKVPLFESVERAIADHPSWSIRE